MERFDGNCFVGNWPFFRIRENTVEKLAALHKKYDITGGLVSSLEAIFYQDPFEAELQLAEQLRGTDYKHIIVLNPALPAWEAELHRCVETFAVAGVRLLPGYHGYNLRDPEMDRVVANIKQYGLQMLITLRMHDDRTGWMIKPESVPLEDIAYFLKCNPDVKILLNHIRPAEIEKLNATGISWDNICIDTCGFKDGTNPIETIGKYDYLKGHIVYGSGAPIMEPYATVFQLETANMDPSEIADIFTAKNL